MLLCLLKEQNNTKAHIIKYHKLIRCFIREESKTFVILPGHPLSPKLLYLPRHNSKFHISWAAQLGKTGRT